jgi:single-strand DNA-binding protein
VLNGTYTVICGNAVDDFALRFTPGGAAVGDVTIAVNSRTQVGGEWEDREDPMYVKVTVWWEYAEHCAESIFKGDRLIAVGEMHVRMWETNDGDPRTAIEMTADEIGPSLRWAEAKVTRLKSGDDRDDRRGGGRGRGRDRDDDDRGRGRGERRGGGRDRDDRGGRSSRGSDRGSGSGRRGSSGRDDRDDRGRGARSSRSVWDDDRADDPGSDLPDEPNF